MYLSIQLQIDDDQKMKNLVEFFQFLIGHILHISQNKILILAPSSVIYLFIIMRPNQRQTETIAFQHQLTFRGVRRNNNRQNLHMAFLAQVLDCSCLTFLAVTEKFIVSGHVVILLKTIFFLTNMHPGRCKQPRLKEPQEGAQTLHRFTDFRSPSNYELSLIISFGIRLLKMFCVQEYFMNY